MNKKQLLRFSLLFLVLFLLPACNQNNHTVEGKTTSQMTTVFETETTPTTNSEISALITTAVVTENTTDTEVSAHVSTTRTPNQVGEKEVVLFYNSNKVLMNNLKGFLIDKKTELTYLYFNLSNVYKEEWIRNQSIRFTEEEYSSLKKYAELCADFEDYYPEIHMIYAEDDKRLLFVLDGFESTWQIVYSTKSIDKSTALDDHWYLLSNP